MNQDKESVWVGESILTHEDEGGRISSASVNLSPHRRAHRQVQPPSMLKDEGDDDLRCSVDTHVTHGDSDSFQLPLFLQQLVHMLSHHLTPKEEGIL